MSTIAIIASNTNGINTINARDLHAALEVGKEFANWIKDRIEKLRFVENVDYCILMPKLANSVGRPVIEYHVSIEMAKHLAMMQNNDKGFEVRNYFIQMEKQAKAVVSILPDFTDPIAAAEAFIQEYKAKKELQLTLDEAKPKIHFADVVSADESKVFSYATAAKILKVKPNAFTKWLRDSGYTRSNNTPFAQYSKYIEFSFSRFRKPDGTYAPPTCYVTNKGLYYFNAKLHNVEINLEGK